VDQQRPFVPRITPTRAQPAVALADFAISRPFVPGADRDTMGSFSVPREEEFVSESAAIQPIEAFLDRVAPPAYGRAAAAADDYAVEDAGVAEDELPPVEHFIDPLPAVDDFAAMEPVQPESRAISFGSLAAVEAVPDDPAGEWGETDWQRYDWRAAAALGESADTEASNAWATTDWDADGRRKKSTRPTPAQAIASALDEIAQRIREGDLPLGGTPTDPGSIAASLAALFGIKR
jgi:hypothetical protein